MPLDPVTKRSDLDVLSKMPKAAWRDIEFYCGPQMSFAFDHAHAQHVYPDRDAGYIESTGRNPAVFQFVAVFRNGIAGERLLFPTLWQAFVRACMDRTVGELTHPLLGKVKAKCRSCRTLADAARRDGVDVEVEFVESTDEADELDALLGQNSPMGNCLAAARNLDDALGNVSPVPELPESLRPSLLDSMKQLSGAVSQFKLGVGNLAGQISSYASAIDDLSEKLRSLDDPKNYKGLDACERIFSSLILLLDETAKKKGKPTTQAIVQTEMPLASVPLMFSMGLSDFLALNPALAARQTVRAGTLVFVNA